MSQIKGRFGFGVRLFYLGSRLLGAMARISRSIHSAFSMGLITDRTFREFDTYPYGDWEGGATVQLKDDEPVPPWIIEWATGSLRPGASILVVGAGGGRDIRALRSLGFSVAGIEYDIPLAQQTRMVLAATRGCEHVEILSPPRYDLPAGDYRFDAVLISRHYLSLIRTRDARTAFLARLRPHLKEGGLLATDYFIRSEDPRSAAALGFRIQVPIANFLRFFQRRRRNHRIEIGDHLDPDLPLLHHHYTKEEIESELIVGGFETIASGATSFGWSIAAPKHRIKRGPSSQQPASPPALTPVAG